MTKTIHPLVTQLQFARYNLERCLEGVSEEDASRRVEPMNCLSWIVGHLANQEQRYWVMVAQGEMVIKDLNDRVGYGKPASTPSLVNCGANPACRKRFAVGAKGHVARQVFEQ